MARPKKKPEDRKSYHLRVPLTDSQRKAIEKACGLCDQDLAEWSRAILLSAANKCIRKAASAVPA